MMNHKEIEFNHNAHKLSGTLTLPENGKADKTIILLHSSERSHRDEDYFTALAAYGADKGIGTFRYDSPGCGKSRGNAFMQSFRDRVEEALFIYKQLSGNPDLGVIGFSGLSEGSVISLMAEQQLDDCGFLAPVSFDPFPCTTERFLKEIEEELIEDKKDKERIDIEIGTIKIWFAYFGVYNLTETELNRIPDVEPAASAKEALRMQAEESEAQQLERVIRIQKQDSLRFEDYSHLGWCLNDIVEKKLNADDFSRNKMLWRELNETDPGLITGKQNCPVFYIWGESDASINQAEAVSLIRKTGKEPAVTIRQYPGAGHSIELEDDTTHPDFFSDLCSWINRL